MDSQNPLSKALDFTTSNAGQLVLAGLIGGVLRWLHTEKTWKGGLASILSGAAIAFYLGPLAVSFWNLSTEDLGLLLGIGFIVGIGGTSIVAFIITIFRALNTQRNAGLAARALVSALWSKVRLLRFSVKTEDDQS